jgi:CHAT domain-containing protein
MNFSAICGMGACSDPLFSHWNTVGERTAAGDKKAKAWLEKRQQQPDDHRPFAHPYYWGAFILQGETGVLPE